MSCNRIHAKLREVQRTSSGPSSAISSTLRFLVICVARKSSCDALGPAAFEASPTVAGSAGRISSDPTSCGASTSGACTAGWPPVAFSLGSFSSSLEMTMGSFAIPESGLDPDAMVGSVDCVVSSRTASGYRLPRRCYITTRACINTHRGMFCTRTYARSIAIVGILATLYLLLEVLIHNLLHSE